MWFIIKKNFDDVVRENTAFVVAIVRKYIRNPEIIKDLTQEIFIRAYQNYDSYAEQGKIQAWLGMIARNKLKNYYKRSSYETDNFSNFSLDGIQDTDGSTLSLHNLISSPQDMPENIVIRNEFVERIINIINTLPQKQRDVIMYRYYYNYSIEEVAQITNMSAGSVKSAGYYGLEKVKKLIDSENPIQNNTQHKYNKQTKGIINMNITNKEAYALLYEYAKGHVSAEDKAALEEYLKTDEESANIVSALKQLHPKLTYAREDETTHYNIGFNLSNGDSVMYSNVSFHIESYKKVNEYIEAHDGHVPDDATWFDVGSDYDTAIATYDNEGNKVETTVSHPEGRNYRRNVKKMKKIFYPVHWHYTVHYFENSSGGIKQLKDAPNLYKASTQNYWGGKAKSALYIAIPGNAANIRMIRGNGWIDCGKYKFVYVDRYITGDEGIFAECTFNLE